MSMLWNKFFDFQRSPVFKAIYELYQQLRVSVYIKKLADENPYVKGHARGTLRYIGNQAIKPLVEIVRENKSSQTRWEAAETLFRIGLEKISYEDRILCWLILKSGGQAVQGANERTVEILIKLFDDQDIEIVVRAGEVLAILRELAVEPMIEMLDHHDKNKVFRAIFVLGEIGDVRALEHLIEKLISPDQEIRSRTIESLKRFGERCRELNLTKVQETLHCLVEKQPTQTKRELARVVAKQTLLQMFTGLRKRKFRLMGHEGVLSSGIPKAPKGRRGLVRIQRRSVNA